MYTKKVQEWTNDLKKLPNEKRGFASALCDVVLMTLALAIYFTINLMGYKLGTNWLIGLVVGAKLSATPLFFAWAQFAMKLEK